MMPATDHRPHQSLAVTGTGPNPELSPATGARPLHRALSALVGISIFFICIYAFSRVSPSLADKPQPQLQAPLQKVALPLQQRHPVRMVFHVDQHMPDARITLQLPDKVELDGLPGQRRFSWVADIRQGRNTLELPLRGLQISSGELRAEVLYQGRRLTVRMGLDVREQPHHEHQPVPERLILVHRPGPPVVAARHT